MPRRAVLLLATIGACCGFAVTLSTRASALDIHTPQVKVPTPHINVPTPTLHPTTPKLNDRHSSGVNALTGGSSKGTGSPGVKTVTGGSSNTTGSPGVKTVTGGSSNATGSPGVKTLTGGSPNNIAPNGANALTGSSNGIGSPGLVITHAPVTGPLTLPNNPPFNRFIPVEVVTAGLIAAAASAQEQQQLSNILGMVYPSPLTWTPTYNPPCPADGSAGVQCLLSGGDDSTYAAVMANFGVAQDQSAVTEAQQALPQGETEAELEAACAVDPSLAACSALAPLQQAQQNLTNAQNASQAFSNTIGVLLWLLSEIEAGVDVPPGASGPAEAAIEAALTACLSDPSSCPAAINALMPVLSGLGIDAATNAPPGSINLCLPGPCAPWSTAYTYGMSQIALVSGTTPTISPDFSQTPPQSLSAQLALDQSYVLSFTSSTSVE
jgi:hypothetical protein